MNDNLYLEGKELKKFIIKRTINQILIYFFLTLIALFVLIPFYWMLATAVKSDAELVKGVTFFPQDWAFENFGKVFVRAPYFGRYFLNTIIVGTLTTIGTLITTILAAFAFARLNFKGKNVLFTILLATMMIPGEVFVISNFVTIGSFGKIPFLSWAGKETFGALVLPFITSVFYIFFLRQTFKQIPNELYLAAKVDGTSDFKYLWKVMIPMAKATITTIFILSMMGAWNAYIWPTLVANSEKMRLVTNGLMQSFTDESGQTPDNLRMAATTLVTIPLLIVFICLRKYIMRGVSRSGIKG